MHHAPDLYLFLALHLVLLVSHHVSELCCDQSTTIERIELHQEIASKTTQHESLQAEHDTLKAESTATISDLETKLADAEKLAKTKALETGEFVRSVKKQVNYAV